LIVATVEQSFTRGQGPVHRREISRTLRAQFVLGACIAFGDTILREVSPRNTREKRLLGNDIVAVVRWISGDPALNDFVAKMLSAITDSPSRSAR
jgi:hypothetical protein